MDFIKTFRNIEAHIASKKMEIVRLKLDKSLQQEEKDKLILEIRKDIESKDKLMLQLINKYCKASSPEIYTHEPEFEIADSGN